MHARMHEMNAYSVPKNVYTLDLFIRAMEADQGVGLLDGPLLKYAHLNIK